MQLSADCCACVQAVWCTRASVATRKNDVYKLLLQLFFKCVFTPKTGNDYPRLLVDEVRYCPRQQKKKRDGDGVGETKLTAMSADRDL